jgi:hypothetical protein
MSYYFNKIFGSTSSTKYLFNTLESLKSTEPGHIVLYFDKINPKIWEDNSSYNDSDAMDVLGKDRFRALMFGIRYSNKPAEKRLEMWETQEEEKGTRKLLSSTPSTRNLAEPGGSEKDRALMERLAKLKEGGRRKRKSMKRKSIKRKSIKKRKSLKKRKSIKR